VPVRLERGMLEPDYINARILAVRDALHAKLGIKRRNLDKAMRRAGRRLPRRIRRQGAVLVQAEKLGGNPKLMRRIDPAAFEKAHAEMMTHLAAIDAADAFKGRLIAITATIAFNVIVLAAAFVTYLWWRGYV